MEKQRFFPGSENQLFPRCPLPAVCSRAARTAPVGRVSNRRKASGSWRGGLQALNLVLRLDYRLSEHVSLFGYVGQFCLVHDDARRAVKAASGPEMRRDITHGGIGIALDF